MNRDGLLGISRVGERLSPVEIVALDQPSAPPPQLAARSALGAERVNVKVSSVIWMWQAIFPKCGFKAAGAGVRTPGVRGCGNWPLGPHNIGYVDSPSW